MYVLYRSFSFQIFSYIFGTQLLSSYVFIRCHCSTFFSVHVIAGVHNFHNHMQLSEQLFRVTSGYLKAGTSFLKMVTGKGGFSKVVNDF
jgi:hypothetical protein